MLQAAKLCGMRCRGEALGLPNREERWMQAVWLPTSPCPGFLPHHYGICAEWYSYIMIYNDICIIDSAGCHSISLGLLILFDIYIFFWYPVHCSGCEDSILIFVQSLI